MKPEEQDFYQKLRQRIKKWSAEDKNQNHPWMKWLLLAPDFFHLLVWLAVDPDVSLDKKAKFGAVIIYFISPIDILSELFIGPAGFVEDVETDSLLNIWVDCHIHHSYLNFTQIGDHYNKSGYYSLGVFHFLFLLCNFFSLCDVHSQDFKCEI